jgi:hypothetical protein
MPSIGLCAVDHDFRARIGGSRQRDPHRLAGSDAAKSSEDTSTAIGKGRQPCLISAQQLLDEREDAVIASQTREDEVELLTVDRS